MSILERQMLAALDRLHRELAGRQSCRWSYDGGRDTYSCPHLSVTGREVVDRVDDMNLFSIQQED